MGIEVGKRRLVYTTSRNNDRNLDFLKRRRIEDSSSSSDHEDNQRGSLSSSSSSEEDSDRDDSHVSLRQSVDDRDLEITKKREEILDTSEIKPIERQKKSYDDEQGDVDQICKWFMDRYKFPKILYASELLEKATPLLPIVRDMYRGLVDSHYKFEANEMRQSSQRAILSVQEFRNMDLTKFTAGYYGMKRQFQIGEVILQKYKSFLLRRQGDTMKWWGVSDFAHYVLAPEVLVSLCIKEMQLSDDVYDKNARERAYDIFVNTVKFGTLVADQSPLEPWEVTP
ncbi:ZYRO0F16126p [Zygosaccharomyces rouxii]|uniref:Restriction of telomere capping protein 4 n=1 Tax=Zygosaccharomyces rouxii (strain ATCC 2623 / CBS 732 / NBRC 1130 / NCYC 568 / NRRL Y-229) TaxID=559307 RepID=RTC4_ZYGRC|nr:uncharacterized protein ZYRO0F16126g [Zygosaccharomyces rouxii]C5DYV8.1 RecName: Full=Restriction of telomere capping protein 4 [Zygosaccharomyces rouxii CBS 732]KAH9201318.1 restriction of telomere capping protein 4 [Zygosaccharomyces rouxii]CAQ43402.1 Uncharacterized protein YNL254C [Zygosaccharomyces rouxii]CAR28969.1 ZYRO0F16126p [Zygosaccharomyces rouxii]